MKRIANNATAYPEDLEPRDRDEDPPEPWPDPELADREADRYEEHLDRQAELRETLYWRAP